MIYLQYKPIGGVALKKLIFVLTILNVMLIFCIILNFHNDKEKTNNQRDRLLKGEILHISNSTKIDLDGDGKKELIRYENRDEDKLSYSLSIGDFSIGIKGYNVRNDGIYLAKLSGTINRDKNIQIIVEQSDGGEFGFYSVYYYDIENQDAISYIGYLELLPYKIDEYTFKALANGNVLEQKLEQEFQIASGFIKNKRICSLYKIPKGTYPIGTIVETKKAIRIYGSQDTSNILGIIPENKEVILCSTNNYNWLYVKYMDEDIYGWIPLVENSSLIKINEDSFYITDVFEGIYLTDF